MLFDIDLLMVNRKANVKKFSSFKLSFFWCKREVFTTLPDTGVVIVVSKVSRFSPYNFRPYFSLTEKMSYKPGV